MIKKMIGGQKLRDLGSSRYTDDVDYLIYDETDSRLFIHDSDDDIVNAANHPFYTEIWDMDLNSNEVSLQALLDMSAFTFVQHCKNMNFDKADTKEFDIKFLVRKMNGVCNFDIAKKYIEDGEITEVEKIIASVKF